MKNDYLPMNRHDMSIRGWKQCDFIYVSGDAYVDHPSFGTAIKVLTPVYAFGIRL